MNKREIIVYWTDDYNMPRQLNLTPYLDGELVSEFGEVSNVEAGVSFSSIFVQWDESSRANFYNIYLDGVQHNTEPIEGNFYLMVDVPDGVYQLQVSTAFDSQAGPLSDPVEVTVAAVPQNFQALQEEFDLTLSWDAVPDVLGYNLYVNGEKINSDLLEATEYTIEEIESGEYTFIVRSVFVYQGHPPEEITESGDSEIIQLEILEQINVEYGSPESSLQTYSDNMILDTQEYQSPKAEPTTD